MPATLKRARAARPALSSAAFSGEPVQSARVACSGVGGNESACLRLFFQFPFFQHIASRLRCTAGPVMRLALEQRHKTKRRGRCDAERQHNKQRQRRGHEETQRERDSKKNKMHKRTRKTAQP